MIKKQQILVKQIVGTDYESNCYITYNPITKKSIIIDPNDYHQIKRFVIEQQLTNEYIFLTHEHYDHVAGLSLVKKNIGGTIFASEICHKGLKNVQKLLNRTYPIHMSFIGREKRDVPQFEEAQADKTFQLQYEMQWEECTILLKETTGHSKGSISICFIDKMIFSGDAFLYGKPIITKMLGGSKEEYQNSTLAYYKTLPSNIRVFPGHGEMFLLKETSQFLKK